MPNSKQEQLNLFEGLEKYTEEDLATIFRGCKNMGINLMGVNPFEQKNDDKISNKQIMEKLELLENKLKLIESLMDYIFKGHVLINGKFIKIN